MPSARAGRLYPGGSAPQRPGRGVSMTSLRPVTFAVVAATLIGVSGCRTAGMGNLTGRDALPSRAEESAADLLVEHNRNAERVQSLEAMPAVSFANRGATG